MQHRRWFSFGLAATTMLLIGATAWAALTSASFRLANNTFQGGLSGSGVASTSGSYRLTAVTFGTVSNTLGSATFRLCTGFACASPVYGLNLTSLQK